MFKYIAAACAAVGLSFAAAPSSHAAPVDVELQLLVDVSGSVSTSEFNLQRDAYEAAFRDTSIINTIQGGDIGSIAVQLVYWATNAVVGVDWMHVSDSASSNAFADAVAGAPRPFSGGTNAYTAINFGTPLFDDNGFEGTRQVMDVSGDGTSNNALTAQARDNALANGVDAINGLPIVLGSTSLENWYQSYIVGGEDGFLVVANDFESFKDAIFEKLQREISGQPEIPVPAALPLLLTGAGALWGASRRRKKAAAAA